MKTNPTPFEKTHFVTLFCFRLLLAAVVVLFSHGTGCFLGNHIQFLRPIQFPEYQTDVQWCRFDTPSCGWGDRHCSRSTLRSGHLLLPQAVGGLSSTFENLTKQPPTLLMWRLPLRMFKLGEAQCNGSSLQLICTNTYLYVPFGVLCINIKKNHCSSKPGDGVFLSVENSL